MNSTVRNVMFICVLYVVAGCSLLTSSGNDNPTYRDLWDRVGPESYTIVQTLQCFCPNGGRQVSITVVNGAIASAKFLDNNSPVDSHFIRQYFTIGQLFDKLDEIRARDPDELRIEHDTTFGYPSLIYADFIKQAVDDEWAVRTELVQPDR